MEQARRLTDSHPCAGVVLHTAHKQTERGWGLSWKVTNCEVYKVESLLAPVPALGWEEEIRGGKRLRLAKAFLCNTLGCESEIARMALSKLFCSCFTFCSEAPLSSTRATFPGWHHVTAHSPPAASAVPSGGTDFWPTSVIYHLSQPVISCTLLDFSLPSFRHQGKCMINPFSAWQRLWCFSQCSGCAEPWGLCRRVLCEGTGPQPYMPLGMSLTALLSCRGMLWMKSLKIRGCRTETSFSLPSSPSLLHSFLCLCSRCPEMQLEILTEGYLLVSLAVCWGGDVHGAACWDPCLSEAELCSCQSL